MTTAITAPADEPDDSKPPLRRRQRKPRNPNGAGTINLRSDGRYQGRAYVLTTAGTHVRRSVYGRTWEEVHTKLVELQSNSRQGVPVPEKSVKLGDYLAYWLAEVVRVERRPKTYQGYESVVRLHLIPGLGKKRLDKLTAQEVRTWLNRVRDVCQCCKHGWDKAREKPECCAAGECCESHLSRRMIQFMHAVLRNALGHAVREELITRNVAQLVRVPVPKYRTGQGLTVAQARLVLKAARDDRFYALYVLALRGGYWGGHGQNRGQCCCVRSARRDLRGAGLFVEPDDGKRPAAWGSGGSPPG